jgi:hypothetical protein
MIHERFSSRAWLLDGPIHSLPGILQWEASQLSFVMLDQGTFSDERFGALWQKWKTAQYDGSADFPTPLFTVTRDAVSGFRIPWYYFGAGAFMTIQGTPLRFSFVKPQNTVEPTYYSEAFNAWRGGQGQQEVNLLEGKQSGKTWKRLLTS